MERIQDKSARSIGLRRRSSQRAQCRIKGSCAATTWKVQGTTQPTCEPMTEVWSSNMWADAKHIVLVDTKTSFSAGPCFGVPDCSPLAALLRSLPVHPQHMRSLCQPNGKASFQPCKGALCMLPLITTSWTFQYESAERNCTPSYMPGTWGWDVQTKSWRGWEAGARKGTVSQQDMKQIQ